MAGLKVLVLVFGILLVLGSKDVFSASYSCCCHGPDGVGACQCTINDLSGSQCGPDSSYIRHCTDCSGPDGRVCEYSPLLGHYHVMMEYYCNNGECVTSASYPIFCESDQTCVNGECVCVPDCGNWAQCCLNVDCGDIDDGCGNPYWCGGCSDRATNEYRCSPSDERRPQRKWISVYCHNNECIDGSSYWSNLNRCPEGTVCFSDGTSYSCVPEEACSDHTTEAHCGGSSLNCNWCGPACDTYGRYRKAECVSGSCPSRSCSLLNCLVAQCQTTSAGTTYRDNKNSCTDYSPSGVTGKYAGGSLSCTGTCQVDTSGCNCAQITGISVSGSTPYRKGSTVTLQCTANYAGLTSIRGTINGVACTAGSWSGNTQSFSCTITSMGTQTLRCSVNTNINCQSGNDRETTINALAQFCSEYNSGTPCNNDPMCDWCGPECDSNGKYRAAVCVNSGTCPGRDCNIEECPAAQCEPNYYLPGDPFIYRDSKNSCRDYGSPEYEGGTLSCDTNTCQVNTSSCWRYCGGTEPTGPGITKGRNHYTDSENPKTWTYTSSGSLNPCGWRCSAGYSPIDYSAIGDARASARFMPSSDSAGWRPSCCPNGNMCTYNNQCFTHTVVYAYDNPVMRALGYFTNVFRDVYCNNNYWEGGDDSRNACDSIVGVGHWRRGGEIASLTCCGDDSGEYLKDYTIGDDTQEQLRTLPDDDSSSPSCCNQDSKCTFRNRCYSNGAVTTYYSSTNSMVSGNSDNFLAVFCNNNVWQGGDDSLAACNAIVGTGRWQIQGNAPTGKDACCGDDPNEFAKTYQALLDTRQDERDMPLTDSTSPSCCVENTQCTHDNACYQHETVYTFDGSVNPAGTALNVFKDVYCKEGLWHGGDDSEEACNEIVGSGNWNLGGNAPRGATTCCGDDPNEHRLVCKVGEGNSQASCA